MKKHGMTGKQNALKEEGMKKSTQLQIRVKVEDKARWKAAAGEGGLSEWVIDACNEKLRRKS